MSINSGFNFDNSLNKRRNSNPARAFLWHVSLPDLTVPPSDDHGSQSFRTANANWRAGDDRNIDMELLNAVVTSITTPFFQFETNNVTSGATYWYEAKHNDISDINITLEEQETGLVYDYLNNWKELIVDPNGRYNPPHFYKRDITLYLLNVAKGEFRAFEFKNYFIKEVSSKTHTYDSNEALTYDISLSGDSLERILTLSGPDLDQELATTSQNLSLTDISYNRFDFDGVPAESISGILNDVGRRVI